MSLSDLLEVHLLLGPSVLDFVEEKTVSEIFEKLRLSNVLVFLHDDEGEKHVHLISQIVKSRRKARFQRCRIVIQGNNLKGKAELF